MIKPILPLEKRLRGVIDPRTGVVIRLHGMIERLYVASGAERAIAAAAQINRHDRTVRRPRPHLWIHEIDHLERERVQRLRRVQGDDADPVPRGGVPLRQNRRGLSIVQQSFGNHRKAPRERFSLRAAGPGEHARLA